MSKKIIQTVVLLILLVILPAISWFYLSNGLDYRINSLEKLSVKGHLPEQSPYLKGRIQIIHPPHIFEARLTSIAEHFSDVDTLVTFLEVEPEELQKNDVFSTVWDEKGFTVNWSEAIFLSNRSNEIVQCYRAGEDDDLAQLTEDIAFMVPPTPEKDFEFKREREK